MGFFGMASSAQSLASDKSIHGEVSRAVRASYLFHSRCPGFFLSTSQCTLGLARVNQGIPKMTGLSLLQAASQSEKDEAVEPIIPKAYEEFRDVFSEEKANVLPEHGKNDHAIDLMNERQPPYDFIYNLSETELTILRQYIDKHLINQFIRSFKSPAGTLILFVKKYSLPLVGELLNRLKKAKRFTQLGLITAYH